MLSLHDALPICSASPRHELSPGDSSIKRHGALFARMVSVAPETGAIAVQWTTVPGRTCPRSALHYLYPLGIPLLTAPDVCFLTMPLVNISSCATGHPPVRCSVWPPRVAPH